MTLFTTKSINNTNTFTIINAWSYKVRAVICSFSFSKIKILGYGEKRQSRLDIINNEINNIPWVCETIKQAISKAEIQAWVQPKEIIINPFFSNVFFYTKKIHYKVKDNSKQLEKKDVFWIIDYAEHIAFHSILDDIQNKFWFHKADISHILSNISKITADGKPIKKLESIQCEDINLNILHAFIPKINHTLIYDIIHFLKKDIVHIIPEEYAIAKVWEYAKDNLILDIWNSSTSISFKLSGNILSSSVKIDIWIGDLVKEIKKNSSRNRTEIIKKLDRKDLFKKEKKHFLSFFWDAIITGLEEILQWKVCPFECTLIWWGANNLFIKEYLTEIKFATHGIKILKPLQFVPPSIDEIKKISWVEDILKISNINLIAQIIASHKIFYSSHDTIEKALKKSVEKIFS